LDSTVLEESTFSMDNVRNTTITIQFLVLTFFI